MKNKIAFQYDAYRPLVDRGGGGGCTDKCKNITLPQTSFAGSNDFTMMKKRLISMKLLQFIETSQINFLRTICSLYFAARSSYSRTSFLILPFFLAINNILWSPVMPVNAMCIDIVSRNLTLES